MSAADDEIQLQNPEAGPSGLNRNDAGPSSSSSKSKLPDIADLPPLRKPEVDPGLILVIKKTDAYKQCYDRLRLQIAWLLQYQRLNKGLIQEERKKEFDKLFDQWLAGVEKKKAPGKVSELFKKKGHKEVAALWDQFIAVRKLMEEDVKKAGKQPAGPEPTETPAVTTAEP